MNRFIALAGALGAACAASFAITSAMRRYALHRGILDRPVERSAHDVPVPRGGGWALVAATVATATIALVVGWLPTRTWAALVGGGLVVSSVGWIDDRVGLSRTLRLAVHALAAAWAVAWLGGAPTLDLGIGILDLGAVGGVVAVTMLVWCVNLYNFMDGIDGLAGGEALTAGAIGGLLLLVGGDWGLGAVALGAAAGSLGFLPWNWTPARIFMGDVGSGFLGFVFATLALASGMTGSVPLAMWGVLLGVFLFDATVTIVRRAMRGELWYREHSCHAYQRAVQSGWTHTQVTTAVLLLNLGLGALAVLGTTRRPLVLPAFGMALVLLAAAYLWIERRMPPPVSPTRRPSTSGRRAVTS